MFIFCLQLQFTICLPSFCLVFLKKLRVAQKTMLLQQKKYFTKNYVAYRNCVWHKQYYASKENYTQSCAQKRDLYLLNIFIVV